MGDVGWNVAARPKLLRERGTQGHDTLGAICAQDALLDPGSA